MVLTGICHPAFAFFRWGWDKVQNEWIVENCTLTEPYALNQRMQFTNAIGFEGKFYALSLQGSLAVIEDNDSCFQITAIGANRAMPSVVSRQFREYLLESNREILLVFLISRKSIDVVDDVEVFRLDISKLLWVKVESLGDMMLFVEDECCMGLSASKVGSKGNCIYFTHHRVKDWWVFDMETCCISQTSGPNIEFTKSLMWD
ncbi:putative F-box protein [Forsythia ovata]